MLLKLAAFSFVRVCYFALATKECGKPIICGGTCDRTCDNTCLCNDTDSIMYGGKCQSADFCQSEFLHLEDCIEEGGPSCPNKMVGTQEVLETFTKYDYRIDVRSMSEWDEGHANESTHTPGLSKNPASDYLDIIGGLENNSILVYCRSGGRAFSASLNLLKYGFKNVKSFYQGGFPDLQKAIVKQSEALGKQHPNKNYCYITGGSDICPSPLPLSHIKTAECIKKLGNNIKLVDVRPKVKGMMKSLPNAQRVPNKPGKIRAFLKTVDNGTTIVVFCKEGVLAFMAAKEMRKIWKGKLYFIDNGGYEEVKKIEGIRKL